MTTEHAPIFFDPTVLRLALYRTHHAATHTTGTLWVDGVEFCKTLEDAVRAIKVYGETAIPTGTYQVLINYSPKFNRRLPLLQNVEGFAGIRLHPGNTVADTAGCPLVGMTVDEHTGVLKASKQAFDKLFALMEKAIAAGKTITLTIK